jgi:hypothetical protein
MTHPRMEMTRNRAPYALPALIVGGLAVVVALFLSALLGCLLGLGATIMGGVAYADTRSHGYDGEEIALIGAALGVVAVVLMFVGLAVM